MAETKTKEDNVVQLGMFPGMKTRLSPDDRQAGVRLPRLVGVVAIKIADRETGEEIVRKIQVETNVDSAIGELVIAAIQHRRTLADIDSFSKGRNG